MKQALTFLILKQISCLARSVFSTAEYSNLARQLLSLTEEADLQLSTSNGLFEVAPVHLPVDPAGNCNHYGWPVAAILNDTIVVMHRRVPGHNPCGAGVFHPMMSYGVVLCSHDEGPTWSKPYDLRNCMSGENHHRGGVVPLSHRAKFDPDNTSALGYKVHLHAIGTTQDGV